MSPGDVEAQLEELHEVSFGWALSCCGWDRSEAEDVLQTVYLKVISGRARFEGRSAFKTWLFGVIRRTAQEFHRRAKVRHRRAVEIPPDELPLASTEDPVLGMERAETGRRLVAALERLSERQREVLHLVFYEDLTIAQAAEVMQVSLGSARTHYERGKARLRVLLERRPHGERSIEGS